METIVSTTPVMKIIPPYTPELLPSCVRYLKSYLDSFRNNSPVVLEFGTGWSTIWFAWHGCWTLSLEHDRDWWKEVGDVLERERLSAHVLLLPPDKFAPLVSGCRDSTFDLVYVDCVDEYRNEVAFASMSKVKSGGLLVLDDTHWPLWRPVLDSIPLNRFTLDKVFEGNHIRKDGQTHYHHTSIYRRV